MTTPAQLALAAVQQGRPRRVSGRRRGAQPRPAPSFAPLPCVVLGIDPGATSGWAVMAQGALCRERWEPSVTDIIRGAPGPRRLLGEARSFDDRDRAVWSALDTAARSGLPLVIVAEKWLMHGMSHDSFAGLAASWGRWADALEKRGVPSSRVVRVYTQTWRAAVLGGRNEKGGTPWKARAQAWARAAFGVEAGPDAAEALAIAAWGSRAGEVLAVLPKRRDAR